ncbi:MAG: GNAT family N-acetyltransferase [Proteobacteria bacterium]|nr:GNAT family N-acetyltransferase [Pseudomonadota bacterium]
MERQEKSRKGANMGENRFVIRQMTKDDVELAVDWAAREGWNPGLNDAACFYNTDPQGFFIGELNSEPIGCISAVSYGDSFGFIGFYIVREELRGKWYGVELGKRAMSYLGARNIGIDGVVKKIKNYEKFGFTLAHRNIRYEGRGGGSGSTGVVELAALPFETIVFYDAGIFPAKRATFLERWIIQPDGASLGFLEDGKLKGYGVIRPCRTGFKIGPLFADSFDIAERLFDALTGKVSAQAPVFLDVPAINPPALALAQGHNMTPVFETGRMYNKKMPAVPIRKIFGITSFELG